MPRQLSDQERQVLELRKLHPGWTQVRIGKELGITRHAVHGTLKAAKKKIDTRGASGTQENTLQLSKTDEWASVFASCAGDTNLQTVAEKAKEEGMTVGAARTLITYAKRMFPGTNAALGEFKVEEFEKEIQYGLMRVMRSVNRMGEEDLDEVSLKDRAITMGIMFDKWRLLLEKPTEIVRTESDQSALTEVAVTLVKELTRRSRVHGEEHAILDINPTTGETEFALEETLQGSDS